MRKHITYLVMALELDQRCLHAVFWNGLDSNYRLYFRIVEALLSRDYNWAYSVSSLGDYTHHFQRGKLAFTLHRRDLQELGPNIYLFNLDVRLVCHPALFPFRSQRTGMCSRCQSGEETCSKGLDFETLEEFFNHVLIHLDGH
jgi:hypothetical protein